jgi:nucleoside-diphosphate-sugar epimerase
MGSLSGLEEVGVRKGSFLPGVTRALVTGAAGFIGCRLVDALHAVGVDVIGIDDERSGDWSRVDAGCTRIRRDLCDLSSRELEGLCRDVDVVYHLAAEKHNQAKDRPQEIIDVNVSATYRLFEAAARASRPKVVFTSSLYAYGSMGPDPMRESDIALPRTVYGVSKLAGEHLLRVLEDEHALQWTIARLFFVYGPRQFAGGGYKSVIVSNFERILHGERPTVYGDGEQVLDYVYIDDAISALVAMAPNGHHGKTMNVASGRGLSVNELTTAMLTVSGSSLTPTPRPADWTAGSSRVGDPTLAARELDWKSDTPIEIGLQRCWDWTRRHSHS